MTLAPNVGRVTIEKPKKNICKVNNLTSKVPNGENNNVPKRHRQNREKPSTPGVTTGTQRTEGADAHETRPSAKCSDLQSKGRSSALGTHYGEGTPEQGGRLTSNFPWEI